MAEERTREVLELQVPTTLKSLFEALIFAAREPLTIKQMKDIYGGDGPQSFLRQLEAEEIEAAVNDLNAEYEKADKPYRIVQIAGGYQFATLPAYAEWIGRLYKELGRRKLSQSGVETLAIIAYKQPVTKADIESIRGVNCDYVLKTLLEKELVTIVGRAHAPGRPLLYGTTREFLRHFGLNDITDLPRPREIEEILGESQFETERRMLEAQAGAEKMKEEEPDFKSRLPHIPKKKSDLETPVEIKPKENQRMIRTVQKQEPRQEDPTSPEGDSLLGRDIEQNSPVLETTSTGIPSGEDLGVNASVITKGPELVTEETGSVGGLPKPEETERAVEPGADAVKRAKEPVAGAGSESIQEESKELPSEDVVVHDVAVPRPLVPSREEKETAQDVQSVPSPSTQHKSKWQSWKEKVQGFIRKIFG